MKNVLRSNWVKTVAMLAGFACSFSVARQWIPPYDFYVRQSVWMAWLKMDSAPALIVFAASVVLLGVSAWFSGGRHAPRWWRRLDYAVLSAAVVIVVSLCVVVVLGRHEYSLVLFSFSALAYAAFMVYVMESTARLRDKQMMQTLLWARFFRQHPPIRPPGFFMAAMLLGCLCYLAVDFINMLTGILQYFRVNPHRAADIQINIVEMLFAALTLAGLTYFCGFILTLSARFERANVEKIRAERFKSELIANVSHDIRTPLTSIINYVDLLKTLPAKHPDQKTYVDVLERKSSRLKTLIGDLMEASKASTGNLPVHLCEINLCEIVGQIAGEFDDLICERGLTLVTRLPEDPVVVQTDGGHLWRVLENLFGNAVKYALPGTRVFAEITRREGLAVLSIKNTSKTPIEQDTGLLTEQFIRGDRARSTEGSGLGLYIAKSLMELMGGRLEIRATGDLFEAQVIMGG